MSVTEDVSNVRVGTILRLVDSHFSLKHHFMQGMQVSSKICVHKVFKQGGNLSTQNCKFLTKTLQNCIQSNVKYLETSCFQTKIQTQIFFIHV